MIIYRILQIILTFQALKHVTYVLANLVFGEYMIIFTHIDFQPVVPATHLKCSRIYNQIHSHLSLNRKNIFSPSFVVMYLMVIQMSECTE